jgi:hypothetical protein
LLLLLLMRGAGGCPAKVLPKTRTASDVLIAAAAALTLVDAQPRHSFQTHLAYGLPLKSRRHGQAHDGRVVVGLLHL